jgi:hypothetical protein
MATASLFSLNVKNTTVAVMVPDDDVARIMYYLYCVTVGVGHDILHDDLVDYRKYQQLSAVRKALVFEAALKYSPDVFIDEVIFRDDEGKVVTGTTSNEFCDISVACDIVSLQRDVVIAGEVRTLTKVMFFASSWLDRYYNGPVARVVLKSKHCMHCKGGDGMCNCDACPRNSNSQCQPFLSLLIDAMGGTSIRSPSPSPVPPAPAKSSTSHECTCDGCRRTHFEGTRYKCADCYDFDLCKTCYANNLHDLSHPFLQIDRPGASAIRLSPRIPPRPLQAAIPPSSTPPSYASATTTSPYFYHDMTVSELKKYLRERGVVCTDILDRVTLCQRVWEAHCDCMSMDELTRFLTENNISSSDCRDIASRRQKAKETFQADRSMAPKYTQDRPMATKHDVPPILRIQEHDVVTLTGLNRAEMNDKRATVIHPDCGGGRAEVRLEESGKVVKVKLENIAPVLSIQEHDVVTLTGLSRAEMNGKHATVIHPDCGGGRAEVCLEGSGKVVKVKLENLVFVSNNSDEYLD